MWLAIILIGTITFLLYFLLKPSKNFWEAYGVSQITTSSLTDKLQMFRGKKTVADFDAVAYQHLSVTGEKFCGVVEMQQPYLLVKDLDIVKKIMIKDFDYFTDRRQVVKKYKLNIMNKTMNNLEGEEWKGVRTALRPILTTGKIRRMMEHFNNVGIEWTEHLKEEIIKNGRDDPITLNVLAETTSFTLDAIAAAVFGMNAGTIRNPESIFAKMSKKISDFSIVVIAKLMLSVNFPRLINSLGISILDEEAILFFESIFSTGLKARMEGKVKANDFIQLIVEARKGELKAIGSDELNNYEKDAQLSEDDNQTEKKKYLNDEDTANAQALTIFFSGFITTNNFIGFVLYMLALHPEIQNKLRGEIDSQLFGEGDGKNIDYDVLNSLTYLDMVCCEVLRKFPPQQRLERKCTKDYQDPSENLRVPKDAVVGIPIHSIHHDKHYYDFPDKFYPEHFSPENKAKRNSYAYMPFGIGPRNCIGMRFALVSSKAAIAHLVHSFKIDPTAKTPIPPMVKNFGLGVQIPDDLELAFKLL